MEIDSIKIDGVEYVGGKKNMISETINKHYNMELTNQVIRKLCGYTSDEMDRNTCASFDKGYREAYAEIKEYMDSLYGKPADEWCKLAYDLVYSRFNSLFIVDDEK